jgi:hypothetical protein
MKKVLLSVVLGAVVFSAGANDEIAVEGECASSLFNSTYFGLGLGGSFLSNEAGLEVGGKSAGSIDKQKINRFLGAVAFGAGRTFGRAYAGGEVLVDFMKSQTNKIKKNGKELGESVRNRGITPSLGMRLGFVHNDCMAYFKPGIVFPSATIRDAEGKEAGSISKVTYFVALGGEKFFGKKFSVRGEVEYVLPAKKTFGDGGDKEKAKANGGFSIRALVAYNIQY